MVEGVPKITSEKLLSEAANRAKSEFFEQHEPRTADTTDWNFGFYSILLEQIFGSLNTKQNNNILKASLVANSF